MIPFRILEWRYHDLLWRYFFIEKIHFIDDDDGLLIVEDLVDLSVWCIEINRKPLVFFIDIYFVLAYVN